jgi:uncharacterized protein YukE
MAEVREAVQRLKIEGSESGLDQVDAKLKKLSGSQQDMGDQFSKSMQKQQQFAASTDRSFAELIPVFDAAKVAAIAVVGAVGAAVIAVIKSVTDSNEALEKMEASAKRAGLSLEQFNTLRHVATEGKVSEDSFAGTAEQVAKLLNDARYGQTEMGRLLDANNVKYKRGNDLLIDTNKLFDIARDLIRRAGTEQDKIRIAEMLGLTKEWVPALDKTREEFMKIGSEASALGIKIDSEAIELAKKFEEEWKKSGDVFSTFIKASLQGLLPWIDKLIEKAKEFREGVSEGGKENLAAGDEFKPTGGRSIGESKKGLDNLTLAMSALTQAWEAGPMSPAGSEKLSAVFKLWTNQADEATKALIRQADALRVVEGLMSEVDQAVNASVKGATEGGWPKFFKEQADMLDAASKAFVEGGKSKIPTRPGAFENVDTRLEERMEEMQIEIEAAGRSTEAVTRLRIAYELERAAKKDGIAVDKEKIEARAAEYAATERLRAQARLTGDVRFEREQLFRGDTDAAVASRLRGAGLAVDLNSATAEAIRLNEQLKQTKGLMVDVSVGFGRDVSNSLFSQKEELDKIHEKQRLGIELTKLEMETLRKGIDIWGALAKAAVNALKRIADTLIDIAIRRLMIQAFGSLFGGGLGSYGGGGVGDQGPTLAMARGLHSGGTVGIDGTPRYIHPAYFEHAPRYHLGIDEVPAILQRGETVIPRGGVKGPVINVFPVAGSTVDVRENSDGSIDLVGRMVDSKIGLYDKSLPDRIAAINRDGRRR